MSTKITPFKVNPTATDLNDSPKKSCSKFGFHWTMIPMAIGVVAAITVVGLSILVAQQLQMYLGIALLVTSVIGFILAGRVRPTSKQLAAQIALKHAELAGVKSTVKDLSNEKSILEKAVIALKKEKNQLDISVTKERENLSALQEQAQKALDKLTRKKSLAQNTDANAQSGGVILKPILKRPTDGSAPSGEDSQSSSRASSPGASEEAPLFPGSTASAAGNSKISRGRSTERTVISTMLPRSLSKEKVTFDLPGASDSNAADTTSKGGSSSLPPPASTPIGAPSSSSVASSAAAQSKRRKGGPLNLSALAKVPPAAISDSGTQLSAPLPNSGTGDPAHEGAT